MDNKKHKLSLREFLKFENNDHICSICKSVKCRKYSHLLREIFCFNSGNLSSKHYFIFQIILFVLMIILFFVLLFFGYA